ncbi:MAG: M6 family metalloprotease domain-containing protein [bacterium]|nr:M6 family metalloprotease domain-containing protein [bacterium]
MRRIHRVPPAPEVMSILYMDYQKVAKKQNLKFLQYLEIIGYANPARDVKGMDDGSRLGVAGSPASIAIPAQPIIGNLQVKVLLIDFPDRKGYLPARHYENLLFSENTYPTGSMRDYYSEVTRGKVEISGTVHGWLRMPEPYSFYTNFESGCEWGSYPRNAQRMAEDAVKKALDYDLVFEPQLDMLNEKIVTALFLVHAGNGAEQMYPGQQGGEIWSHKWNLRKPINVNSNLDASIYLTVPHDCDIGVCAHELGHLAFQWDDFYDPNYGDDGKAWDGSGRWDLMAGGSYNGGGATPAHPAGLHKSQHGWVDMETVTDSCSLKLEPYSESYGKVVKIVSPKYEPGQYLLLENRRRLGFDYALPGEGLLVWRVDESGIQDNPEDAGLFLIQADGRNDLSIPRDRNQGDKGDPFPGSKGTTELKDTGTISTSFPKGKKSGVSLENIFFDSASKVITLNVKFK